MVGDVEIGVVDPDRAGNPQGDLADFLPVARNLRQSPLHRLQQSLVAQPTAGRRRIDSDPTYIGVVVSSRW